MQRRSISMGCGSSRLCIGSGRCCTHGPPPWPFYFQLNIPGIDLVMFLSLRIHTSITTSCIVPKCIFNVTFLHKNQWGVHCANTHRCWGGQLIIGKQRNSILHQIMCRESIGKKHHVGIELGVVKKAVACVVAKISFSTNCTRAAWVYFIESNTYKVRKESIALSLRIGEWKLVWQCAMLDRQSRVSFY